MEVLCFGIARDITGQDRLPVKAANGILTVRDLRNYLDQQYSELTNISRYMIAVNEAYASDDQRVLDTDEIAIIPPVSGG